MINGVQNQVDGKVETFYQSNDPASAWTTTELKNAHKGDIWYNTSDKMTYRYSGTGWVKLADGDAQSAKDLASSKKRVFTATPTVPYEVGDLWVTTLNSTGDLKVCKTARTSGSYTASDWVNATDYIDSAQAGSIAQGKVDAQTQASIFNKLTNNGATQGIFLDGGKVWINGEYIKANSITADRLSISDFTNYAQLNNNTATKYGFTKQADEANGAWLKRNSMARDIFISDYYSCNGGESFRIKYDISTTVKGNSSSGGTDSTYRGTAIGLYCYNGSGTSVGIVYSTRYTNQTVSGSSSTVTIPTTARKFRVFIQTESYGNWSGELKVRNIQVTKMAGGELIVDGSVTASKIAAKTITADKLHADVLSANSIVSIINGGSTTINGGKITTGTITANMITSGTFQGTNFIAGGSSNGNGYIEVKNSSNASTFLANKSGIKAKEIQFIDNPNGGSLNINTLLQKEGMRISYDLASDGFSHSTTYNFYGISMSKTSYTTNYSIEASSDINTFGAVFKRKGTGSESGYSGSAMFGLAGSGKDTGKHYVPSVVYNDAGGSGFVIATSTDSTLKSYNDSWSGTGKVFQVDTNGTTCVRNLKIMGSYSTLLSSNSDSRLKVQTNYGNITIGPYNGDWCHFGTDRAKFWFEKAVYVNGEIYAGSGYNQRVYHTGYKPSPADIGAAKALVSSGGHQGLTLNDGTTSNWIRTTVNGLIPTASTGTSWVGSSSALGTSSWRFGNGYIKEVYTNGLTNDLGDLWITAKAGANTIYTQSKWVCPPNNSTTYLGASGYRWHSVWSANGTIQTSDERFKVKRGFANIGDCFEMVKDVQLYKYTMLNENKEDLTKKQLGKMAMKCEEDEAKVHIGIMAQDLQQYECGKQILVEGKYEKADGTEDTLLSLNPLDMTMAVMGGLKKEIEIREQEVQSLTNQVENLTKEVAELKTMVQQLLILK